ncbi:MAG: sarcosine oxidase subunit alpha family protein [Henriciella sp.]|nr:sarcosine oxidase subunit alpha family protein [Henriciella sp.]
MSGRRLDQGGQVDRSQPLSFTFEGRAYTGFVGDTLASALLANGVSVVGRSFKLHRPRGLFAAGSDEPNALVQLETGARTEPNLKATEIELYEGLSARAVNCWPSARFDLGAVNGLADRFFPAGFYYKTFMWPDWHLYEWAIRRAAGLGKAPKDADPDRYDMRFAHCDVLVVGGGPAGLAAARAAASGGARVMLVEQDAALGGRLNWDAAAIDGTDGLAWTDKVLEELDAAEEAQVLTRTTAIGYFDHNLIGLVERVSDHVEQADSDKPRQRFWQVRAGQVILATGVEERPIVFPGNDRPGVMMASAVRRYLNQYGVAAGQSAVIFANNDEAYLTADTLHAAGVEVAAIVDTRVSVSPDVLAAMSTRAVPIYSEVQITATRGRKALSSVLVSGAQVDEWIDCDLLAVSGGFNPRLQLFRQSGGKPDYDEAKAMFVPDLSVQAETSVGGAAGELGLGEALTVAHEAGVAAVAESGYRAADLVAPVADSRAPQLTPFWRVDEGKGKAFVDFQNDVTVEDIALSARENFVSVEHLKRYTTLGMAPDQGKTSGVTGLAILGELTGRSVAETGATADRFPFVPTALGTLAGQARGELFRPIKRMAAHEVHEELGAVFEEYGGWARPAYYPEPGESGWDAEQREALCVRQAAGLFDGSPLGKIEVVGPDAGTFLDRIYANRLSNLKPGRLRYGLMLNELGVVIDDGVAACLGENHFMVGTTGAGADTIAAWLEEWHQTEWPELDIVIAPMTQQWGVLTLSGPRARDILDAVGVEADISAEAFPHMRFIETNVAGVPARIFRVSFTGELSYEVNVPARRMPDMWRAFMTAGQPFGLSSVGLDAWMVLRTEKGYLHVGADTDGATVPDDIGWARVMKKQSDFIGRRSLTQPENLRTDRYQLVGLETVGSNAMLPVGAHLFMGGADGGSEGYVTSSGFSPTLQHGVALAMVKGGRARMGQVFEVRMDKALHRARIVDPCFYDPSGDRLND